MMKLKVALLIALVATFPNLGKAEVLKGQVSETVTLEEVQKQAFDGIEYKKNLSGYPELDGDCKRNTRIASGRQIGVFGPKVTGVFQANGELEHYFVSAEQGVDYHYKDCHLVGLVYLYGSPALPGATKGLAYHYPSGDLAAVTFSLPDGSRYTFSPEGKALQYEKANQIYDVQHRNIGHSQKL